MDPSCGAAGPRHKKTPVCSKTDRRPAPDQSIESSCYRHRSPLLRGQKAQTGALRAKTAILLTWTMDLRPRSSPTFSRAGPQWRPFGQAAGRPALSDAGAAADSGKNSSSQLRASRFVALSRKAFYDFRYTSSDGRPGIFGFMIQGAGEKSRGDLSVACGDSSPGRGAFSPSVSCADSSLVRGSLSGGKAPGGAGGFRVSVRSGTSRGRGACCARARS